MDEGMVPIKVITVVNTIHFIKYKSSLVHDPLWNNLIQLILSVLKFNANKVITSVNNTSIYHPSRLREYRGTGYRENLRVGG